jgi:hypothetical protein
MKPRRASRSAWRNTQTGNAVVYKGGIMEGDNVLLKKKIITAVDFVINRYTVDLIKKANLMGLEGKQILDVMVDKNADTDEIRVDFVYQEEEKEEV